MRAFVPILSCRDAMYLEQQLLTSDAAVWKAMSAAGTALGESVLRDFSWLRPWPRHPRCLVLVGKGHNAGDALIAAGVLGRALSSLRIYLYPIMGTEAFRPMTLRAFQALRKDPAVRDRLEMVASLPQLAQIAAEQPFDLTLDGMLGAQFRPPLKGAIGECVRWCRAHVVKLGFKVAVDLPSGIGDVSDPEPFVADVTYATGIAKSPLFQAEQRACIGRSRFLDLGFFEHEDALEADDVPLHPTANLLKPMGELRPVCSYKRRFGRIFMLGGSPRLPGAILMAAMAGVKSGGGLVTALVPDSIPRSLAASAPEVMWLSLPADPDGRLSINGVEILSPGTGEVDSLLIGPGLAVNQENFDFVSECLTRFTCPVVLDAGALYPEVLEGLNQRLEDSGPVVLTPHYGEFARLTGKPSHREPTDGELQVFCRKYGVITVLKGPVTRITDGRRVIVVQAGNPVLARGGSGDILSGILATRLAQRSGDPLLAAAEAVVWHGAAADALAREKGEVAVRTTDLLDFLSTALR